MVIVFWFVLDNLSMLFYVSILNFKEKSSWSDKIGVKILFFCIFCSSILFFNLLFDVFVEIQTEYGGYNSINMDLGAIIVFLCISLLSHSNEYLQELEKIRLGTYQSEMMRHFVLRFFLLYGLIIVAIISFQVFEEGVLVGLIGVRAILRIRSKKMRALL